MIVEMSPQDLEEYSKQHHGQFALHQNAAKTFGWRNYLLDDTEQRRFEILEKNGTRSGLYNLYVREASRVTGIFPHMIDAVGITGEILTIIPKF